MVYMVSQKYSTLDGERKGQVWTMRTLCHCRRSISRDIFQLFLAICSLQHLVKNYIQVWHHESLAFDTYNSPSSFRVPYETKNHIAFISISRHIKLTIGFTYLHTLPHME